HVKEFLNNRRNRIDEFLRRAFSELISQVELQLEADIGIAHERIVEKAEKEGVDMIVMSTHGRTGLFHMLIGSVTELVVRHATCPVFSVRPQKETRLAEARAL
ncbi:MAG: universal stress protein, partial [Deltaproteobacteria bacterium]|nr:universal stress protein [Deltaproteobacteria bacterium]